jgi:AraC-like DNA-binding protein
MTMTARANSVTDSATLPAHVVAVLLQGLRDLGYAVEPLITAAGVTAADLADPDARVVCEAYGAVIAGAMNQRYVPNLSLELALRTPLGAWPLLDYLVATSNTVGAGLHQLARYMRLTGSPITITIDDRAFPVRVDLVAAPPFAIEYEVVLIAKHLRDETEGRVTVTDVSFRHTPDDPDAFARLLGCPVRTRAPSNTMGFAAESWELPLRRRDPILRGVLEGHADGMLARLPERRGLALDVQRLLARRIAGGDTSIESVGRALAVSARTLQRRLAAEGISYQRLLDDARKEAAGRYLLESTLAIGEIAYLLAYSEPAPFHRAFKRWYGCTPEAYRRMRRR